MLHPKGMHPGAVWRKSDLQVHTPRDPQWTGTKFKGGSEQNESLREAWADEFVQACIDRDLDMVAITDHHDLCAMPYILRAIARLPLDVPKPWVFPGVEVTCNDSAQCLVIFDVHSDSSLWDRLYGGHLLAIMKPSQDAEVAPQAIPCGRDIDDFMSNLASDPHLSIRTVVLPNCGDEGSHKTIIRTGFAPRFRDLAFDGAYTDKGFENLKEITIKRIHGQILEWGTRRRGIIPTGDNRTNTYEQLGSRPCFIKIGEPTAEGLRQVLLADEARLSYAAPDTPNQRVLELHVTSTLCGDDFRLALNDGYTALIGGRGSGKSAVLEYLRFGIGRSTSDTTSNDDQSNQREKNLIADTLGNGSVRVVLERDGVQETWIRNGADSSLITVHIGAEEPEQITIEAAQQRFRARAFSQKQLSTLVGSGALASEQLTGIAAAEAIDKRQTIEQDIVRLKREIATAFQKVVQLWTAEADLVASTGIVNDLERRKDAVKKKLEDSGLSADKQKILDDAPGFKIAQTMFKETKDQIDSDVQNVSALLNKYPSIIVDDWTKAIHFPEVDEFLSKTSATRTSISARINEICSELSALEASRATYETDFTKKLDVFIPSYKEVREQQASMKSQMEESAKLDKELESAEKQDRKNKDSVSQFRNAVIELTSSRYALFAKTSEMKEVLEEAAARVATMSDGSLKATVHLEAVPKQYVEAMSRLCENQRVRDVGSKCEDRVKALLQDENGWHNAVASLMNIYQTRVKAKRTFGTPSGSPQTLAELEKALFSLTSQQAQGIYGSLDDPKILALLTSAPEAFISFEYKDGKKFITFDKASPGQQAAALLHLLLRQEAGTLIIDQPEDDLDNKIIMSIVKLVTTAKRKRQLIFSTHNANFVVNGDADKVIALMPATEDESATESENSARIAVEVDGAIETPAVRVLITDTVEGGKEAFELRSRKYLFSAL